MKQKPLSYLSTFTSTSKNAFTLSSLAISIIGFANTFPDSLSWMVKAMGILVFIFSMAYAMQTTSAFQSYHDIIKRSLNNSDDKTEMELERSLLADLQWYIYMIYIYVIIMTLVVIMFASFKIDKWFPSIYGNSRKNSLN